MIKIFDKSKSKYVKYYPDSYLPTIRNLVSDLNFVHAELVDTQSDNEIVDGNEWELFDKKIQFLVEFYNRCVAISLYRCPILFHTQLPNFIPALTESMIHKYCEFNDLTFEEAKVHLELLFELAQSQSWEMYCFYDKWANEMKYCDSIESLTETHKNAMYKINNHNAM